MRAVLVLAVAACGRVGFDPVVVDGANEDAAPPQMIRLDVVLLTSLTTCMIGDACVGPTCFDISDDAGTPSVSIEVNSNLLAVAPGDVRIAGAARSQCMTMTLDAAEVLAVRAGLNVFAADVATWTNDTVQLDVQVHETTFTGEVGVFARIQWFTQTNTQAIAANLGLSAATDAVFAIQDVRDDTSGLHLPTGLTCSLSLSAATGPAGAGYSWLHTGTTFSANQCASSLGVHSELLEQVVFGVRQLSGVTDLYDGSYPSCGSGDPDPTKWFPTARECASDPDWSQCGGGGCGLPYMQHLWEAHWDAARSFTGNHCRDGVMNFGETAIDTGGACL